MCRGWYVSETRVGVFFLCAGLLVVPLGTVAHTHAWWKRPPTDNEYHTRGWGVDSVRNARVCACDVCDCVCVCVCVVWKGEEHVAKVWRWHTLARSLCLIM